MFDEETKQQTLLIAQGIQTQQINEQIIGALQADVVTFEFFGSYESVVEANAKLQDLVVLYINESALPETASAALEHMIEVANTHGVPHRFHPESSTENVLRVLEELKRYLEDPSRESGEKSDYVKEFEEQYGKDIAIYNNPLFRDELGLAETSLTFPMDYDDIPEFLRVNSELLGLSAPDDIMRDYNLAVRYERALTGVFPEVYPDVYKTFREQRDSEMLASIDNEEFVYLNIPVEGLDVSQADISRAAEYLLTQMGAPDTVIAFEDPFPGKMTFQLPASEVADFREQLEEYLTPEGVAVGPVAVAMWGR